MFMVRVVFSPAFGPVWVVIVHSDVAEVECLVCELTRHGPRLQLDVGNLDMSATEVLWGRQRVHFVDGRTGLKPLELVKE